MALAAFSILVLLFMDDPDYYKVWSPRQSNNDPMNLRIDPLYRLNEQQKRSWTNWLGNPYFLAGVIQFLVRWVGCEQYLLKFGAKPNAWRRIQAVVGHRFLLSVKIATLACGIACDFWRVLGVAGLVMLLEVHAEVLQNGGDLGACVRSYCWWFRWSGAGVAGAGGEHVLGGAAGGELQKSLRDWRKLEGDLAAMYVAQLTRDIPACRRMFTSRAALETYFAFAREEMAMLRKQVG